MPRPAQPLSAGLQVSIMQHVWQRDCLDVWPAASPAIFEQSLSHCVQKGSTDNQQLLPGISRRARGARSVVRSHGYHSHLRCEYAHVRKQPVLLNQMLCRARIPDISPLCSVARILSKLPVETSKKQTFCQVQASRRGKQWQLPSQHCRGRSYGDCHLKRCLIQQRLANSASGKTQRSLSAL